ncbi:MAG: SGNH/GDSL hydrolase family protein [Saprospiraceae bacterium]
MKKKYSNKVKVTAIFLITVLFLAVILIIGETLCRFNKEYGRGGFAFDRTLIWRLNKNFTGQKPYAQGMIPGKEPFVLSLNNRGFRGGEFKKEKEKGIKRIMVLGDSYTAGLDYPDDEIFTGAFEQKLNAQRNDHYEVMNISCPAWGTDQQYLYWFTEGIKYEPDYLIIMIASNDMRELYNKKVVSLSPEGNIDIKKADLPTKEKWGWYFANRSSLFQYFQKKVWKTNYGDFFKVFHYYPVNYGIKDTTDWDAPNYLKEPFPEIEATYQLFEKLLEEIKESCEKNGTKLLLGKIPAKVEFDGTYETAEHDPTIISNMTKLIAERQGIPYLDLNEMLAKKEDPLNVFMSWEYHFNKEGHDFAAEHLFDFFNQLDF